MTVTVPEKYEGRLLSEFLTESGYQIDMPCGGTGSCGKCTVTLADGQTVKSCRTVCRKGMQVNVDNIPEKTDIWDGRYLFSDIEDNALPKRRGLALDIGTTTLAFAFVNLDSGKVYCKTSCLNPQAQYGADVITRITKSEKQLEDLRKCLLDTVREISQRHFPIETMTVVGNPTMLSIFCGVSPEPMGRAPFTPAFTDAKTFEGKEFGLPAKEIKILSGVSAFFGADALAGIFSLRLYDYKQPVMFIDIGTNGEMALCSPKEKKIYTASVAAGPALEGANISCGAGGVEGAICKVSAANGIFEYRTIGNKPAQGICGSGLIDLISCLLEEKIIDETGSFIQNMPNDGNNAPDSFPLNITAGNCDGKKTLELTQKDIREFQLAKSAVRAGIEALLCRAQIKEEEILRVFIAGGMGYYIDEKSCVNTGLLPKAFTGKTEATGNSALDGAVKALINGCSLLEISELCETVDLNGDKTFSEKFIENMYFPKLI